MRIESRRTLLTASVLDRLLDDDPKTQVEHQNMMILDLPRFKQSVARDMEALLNTRNIDFDDEIESYPNARGSMLNFGIIDLSSLSLLDPDDRSYLRDKIRVTIERHEPRLSKVRVSLDVPDGIERMLRFRVDALLTVHPAKPPVSFDARLQLSSNAYQVKQV
ncbi:MAG: type VI secretion system baseplate subunit TssE [Betaproteobacteria bacterium]